MHCAWNSNHGVSPLSSSSPDPPAPDITDSMVTDAEAALTPEQRDLYGENTLRGMKKFVPVMQRMAVPPEKGCHRRQESAHQASPASSIHRRCRSEAAGWR